MGHSVNIAKPPQVGMACLSNPKFMLAIKLCVAMVLGIVKGKATWLPKGVEPWGFHSNPLRASRCAKLWVSAGISCEEQGCLLESAFLLLLFLLPH